MRMPPDMGVDPKSKFVDTGDPNGMKIGLITRVDELHMKADVKVITGGGDQYEVDLSQAMAGPRSFFGGVPEVGSLVQIGYRRKHKQIYQAIILGYIPTGQHLGLGFDPMSPLDPNDIDPTDTNLASFFGPTVRYRRLKLRPGDVGGLSSAGSEFALNKNVTFSNRAGDLFELRDTDRTMVMQSVNRVASTSGVYELSGPVRRGALFLPSDIFQSDGVTLQTTANSYYGQAELEATGPNTVGGGTYTNTTTGKMLGLFNNQTGEFPPVTYSNGKRTFYPSTIVGTNPEAPSGGDMYTESRMELSHTTDGSQEVRDEIDGFTFDGRRSYIEQAYGTVVGNDAFSSRGLRQYGKILKPVIFDDIVSEGKNRGKFQLDEVPRSPTEPDIEVDTTAGAFLLRIVPPTNQQDTDSQFVASVSKQGKVFLNIPGSKVERYPSGSKNVSMEANLDGALKAFIGADTVFGASVIADLAGGIRARIGHLANGRAIDIEYGSLVKQSFTSSPADNEGNGIALDTTVTGNENKVVSGDHILNAYGAIVHTSNGGYTVMADAVSLSAQTGYTGNFGGIGVTCTDTATYNYAKQVMKNILTGGEINTILSGDLEDTVLAGSRTYTTAAGSTSWDNAGGAFSVSVGVGSYSVSVAAGGISMTASAAVSLTSLTTMAFTASGAITMTSPVSVSLVAPQILLGGAPAVLGVSRGTPMLPPSTPSIDWITGLPLQGCAVVRSL
jgi:hypothetical protein